MTAVLVALIVLTPLAIGSVHRGAVVLMEVAVFCLLILWAVRATQGVAALSGAGAEIKSVRSGSLLAPALGFAALIVFQLIPLPPSVVSFLSPSTYHFFVHALPGWPQTAPYSDDTVSHEATQGTSPAPSELIEKRFNLHQKTPGFTKNWRSLSITPSLTEAALLKYTAYAGLFFLLLGYRFADGREGELRFYRVMLATVATSGLLVAVVGLAERVYWNGKILWFVVPQDWGGPWIGDFTRATGSFVDPDHFANYLAMTFPLVLAITARGLSSASMQQSIAFRIMSGIAAFLIFVAITLSQSRAAWLGAAAALVLFSLFSIDSWLDGYKANNQLRISRRFQMAGRAVHESFTAYTGRAEPRRYLLRVSNRSAAFAASLAITLVLVLLAIFTIGPAGRVQTGLRIGDTIGSDIEGRATVWKDTLRMIRDFPFFGVGLGGWPEIFPRYQSAPWSVFYFRQAHNDYLQFLAETGLISALALVWFFSLIARKCLRAFRHFEADEGALFIALWLSIAVMALHESVDFCLRVPANAFLFALLLALAVRMASTESEDPRPRRVIRPLTAACIGIASVALIVLALRQQGMSYPYDIERPQSIAQARAQVIAHPASGKAHADLLRLSGQGLNATNRLNELEAAVFVSPTDPYLRDLYAQSLAMAGQPTAALEQITRSVFDSPKFETHFYLSKWITLLSIPEQSAVERGFKEAVAARYPGAVEGLGAFDGDFGRISAEAQLFIDAAAAARSDSERSRYLVAAGLARARAGRDDLAENLFRQAIKAAPSDPEAYRQLISRIYGPAKNWQGAQAVLDEAAREAADPLSMELLLADTAQANGNGTLAESALIRALALRPTYEMYVKVGRFYLENQNLDKAVAILEKATENNPVAADGFYWLAAAQEGNYQYSAADRNYARAASLAPQRYNGAHTAFQHRVNRINK